ncbi:MAG: signal recognition particle protein [Candidatus Caccosoma sp.]|nr:signal recognition particle protein [Candidatus Caccosoma sp.]
MAFEGLQDRLQSIFKKISGQGKLTEANMDDMLKEIRIALLEADVNFKVVKHFVNDVKEKAIGQKVISSLTASQMVVKIVKDELVELFGEETKPLNFASSGISTILMCGLNGSGKTTTSAKLAKLLKKQGKNPLLVAADIYRPAAREQLKTLAKSIDVECFTIENESAENIVVKALEYAKEKNNKVVIIDTAGRLQIDEQLMQELVNITNIVNINERLLVIDAMSGQDSVNVANAFNEKVKITGMVMSKLDSDARGGAALSIKYLTGIPIKFITTGEKVDDIEVFHPDRMADRIIGMGDILTLVENVQDKIDEQEAKRQAKKMMQGKYDLEDMLASMEQINKMGSLSKLMKFIPGMPKISEDDMSKGEKELKRVKAVIQSMTKEERRHPEILKASRKIRIAKGCAMEVSDVNQVLKKYDQMKEMMKQMKNKYGRFSNMN